MIKLGKLLGPVILVFALCTLALAYFLFQETLRYRSHEAKLAETLVETAGKLDSGSGISENVTYKAPENKDDKEGGSLGYEARKNSPDDSDASLKLVPELAEKVTGQRDAITGMLVKAAQAMNCPAGQMPNAAKLNNLTSYNSGISPLLQFISARNNRDANLLRRLNQMLSNMSAGQVRANITSNGNLEQADNQVFDVAQKKYGNLVAANKKSMEILKSVANAFNAIKFAGVSWKVPTDPSAFAIRGDSEADLNKLNVLAQAVNANNAELKRLMDRIAKYSEELERVNGVIKDKEAEIAKLNKRAEKAEKTVRDLYASGVTVNDVVPKKPAKIDFANVDKNTMGSILCVVKNSDYVVVDLAQDKVAEGIRMSVHRDGKMVGVVKVDAVNEFNSVCTIEYGEAKAGDSVLVADEAVQNFKLK